MISIKCNLYNVYGKSRHLGEGRIWAISLYFALLKV